MSYASERSLMNGLKIGQMLSAPIQDYLQEKRQRQYQLDDREARRLDNAQGLQQELLLKQALGEIAGVQAAPIQQAKDGRPASIVGLPVKEGDPEQLPVVGPGTFLDTGKNQAFQALKAEQQRKAQEQALRQRLGIENEFAALKPQSYTPGSTVGTIEEIRQGKGVKIPDKEAEAKPFTLSPGEKLFAPDGKTLLAENPKEATDRRPITVSPGSVVIGEDGKEIFRNPATTDKKQSPGDISFKTNVSTFKTKANELKDLVEKFGNVEGGMPWSDPTATAKMGAANYQLAIMYAKIVDPESVAREGEVAAAQKYLIPSGWLTKNSTTLAAIKNMQETVDEYGKNRDEAKGQPSQESPQESDPLGLFNK